MIREDLPKSYYYELPKLAEGNLKDYPRIYAITIALIAHTDSQLDHEHTPSFYCLVPKSFSTNYRRGLGQLRSRFV